MWNRLRWALGLMLMAGHTGAQNSGAAVKWVDLTHAVVVVGPKAGPVERKAAQMLTEEAAKRSGITMPVVAREPAPGTPRIQLAAANRFPKGQDKLNLQGPKTPDGRFAPEGFLLHVFQNRRTPTVVALGNDERGCMFAAGRLLRAMRYSPGKLEAPEMNLLTAPAKPLRGHQIGWRPKSNTYDRWGLKEYEQYIRDLIVWGTNAIELIPFDPDDDPAKGQEMTVKLAEIIASYGLQVWLWFPIDDKTPEGVHGVGLTPGKVPCPSEKDGRRYLLARRRELFKRIKHLDAVFIPGGDPGGCDCEKCAPWVHTMLPLAAEIATLLRETHPKAQMWLSNQSFREADNRFFYAYLAKRPKWLTGLCYSPWAEETLASMRAKTPKQYPLRQYPDITHCVRCQYPARDWDPAFALTLGREPPIYRPRDHAHIARMYQSLTCGAITYSDGVNDDLNKVLWSALLWDPKESLDSILRDYGLYYLGGSMADGVRIAIGLQELEGDWQNPSDSRITFSTWRGIGEASEGLGKNWRFQMALLRATYDLYVYSKSFNDQVTENEVYAALSKEKAQNPARAVAQGLEVLRQKEAAPYQPDLQARMFELGQALYESIGMQLSVPRWGAAGGERGAILDYLDVPLANQEWLKAELTKLAALKDEIAIRAGIERILNWEYPGAGSFYDDLGHPWKQPHLVRQKAWEDDPGYVESPRCDATGPYQNGRQSWNHYAETLYGTPLLMRYEGLDPKASYIVRATYSGRYRPTMTLIANDKWPVHGPVKTPDYPTPMEWPVPREATAGGTLTLKWERVTGRGAQVSEVWLLKR